MKIPSSVIAIEMVKASNIMEDKRFQNAVTGGLMGAAGGGTIQLLRRLFQSKRDAEEEGEPSILKGMLLGGLGGAGLGAGLTHLMRDQDPFRATSDVMSSLSRGMGRKPGMVPYRDGMAPAKFRDGRVPFAQGLMTQAQRDNDFTWAPSYRLGDSLLQENKQLHTPGMPDLPDVKEMQQRAMANNLL